MIETLIRLLPALTPFAWPLVAIVFFLLLRPTIKAALGSRRFSVKAGSFQLEVGDAIERLQGQVEDLQTKVAQLPEATSAPNTLQQEGPASKSPAILWVDDFPKNNAFQIDKLRRSGFRVVPVRTTSEALERLAAGPFDLVISDMGRTENGNECPDAGLLLLASLQQRGIAVPVVFFTSLTAISLYGHRVRAAGAEITTSTVDLYRLITSKTGRQI